MSTRSSVDRHPGPASRAAARTCMLRPKETFRPGQPVMKGHPGLRTRGTGNLMKQPGTGRITERKSLIRTLPGRLHCLNREAATLETTFGSTSPGADRPSFMVCHGAPSIVAGRQADLQQACTLALRKAAGELEGFADCFFLLAGGWAGWTLWTVSGSSSLWGVRRHRPKEAIGGSGDR